MTDKITEPCRICNNKIYLKKDSYVHLIDYKYGVFFMDGYYHNKCYLDNLTKTKIHSEHLNSMSKMAMSLMKRSNKMLKDAGYEDEEEDDKKKEEVFLVG